MSGEVPQSFEFALDGRELECGIRKQGAGNLKITFAAGNNRSVQRTNAPDATVRLTYSGGGVSFSTSSSSSSGSSVVQQNSSSSSSVVQQSTSSSQSSR